MKTVKEQSKPHTQPVTFTLPGGIEAESASLVGDFNGWNPQAHPMRKGEDGRWRVSAELETGREYQFRYLVNAQEWHNDTACDCCPNPYGGENSLLRT